MKILYLGRVKKFEPLLKFMLFSKFMENTRIYPMFTILRPISKLKIAINIIMKIKDTPSVHDYMSHI